MLHVNNKFGQNLNEMNKFKLSNLLVLAFFLIFSSCDKDDPEVINEEEVITTLIYTLTPQGGGSAVTLSFRDLDGDGGDDPVVVDGILSANSIYSGILEVLNEQESPAGDISEEVSEEALEHQFFFETNVVGLSVAYNDQDSNGNPLGLESIVTTTDAASGTLKIILIHEPVKTAAGVSDGDITNAEGEIDIEVTFDVEVQ